MWRGHCGNLWRLKLQLTSASAVTSKSAGVVLGQPVGRTARDATAVSGKAEMCGLLPSPAGSDQALVSGPLQNFLDTSDKVVLPEWLV
jgi:hypothetical protein